MFCCNTALSSNGSIVYLRIFTCDNSAKSISQLSTYCIDIIGLEFCFNRPALITTAGDSPYDVAFTSFVYRGCPTAV